MDASILGPRRRAKTYIESSQAENSAPDFLAGDTPGVHRTTSDRPTDSIAD